MRLCAATAVILTAMQYDKEWVSTKLDEIERKREVLKALEEALGKWEEEVDFGELSPAKQAALIALAEQSVDTLEEMISKLGDDIKSGLHELKDAAIEIKRQQDLTR